MRGDAATPEEKHRAGAAEESAKAEDIIYLDVFVYHLRNKREFQDEPRSIRQIVNDAQFFIVQSDHIATLTCEVYFFAIALDTLIGHLLLQ